MFSRRRKKDNDFIGPSTGVMKWVNRLVHFVFYPVFHPIWFVCGAVVTALLIVAVPSYYGVEFAKIPQWYKAKFEQHYNRAEKVIDAKVVQPLKNTAETSLSGLTGKKINVVSAGSKVARKDEMVTYSSPQIRGRKAFQKAQEIPVDVKASLRRGQPRIEQVYFKRNEALGLRYLDVAEELSGIAEVISANELKVGQRALFLYGIYVAPASRDGLAAMKYLQENIGGKDIECRVGAYTADGIPTAICFYSGINLNQKLVDLNYSKDVSLN